MLAELYPRMHRRFVSLPVFGPIMDAFTEWLVVHGYSGDRVREYCCAVRRLDRQLTRRGVRRLATLTRRRLRACAPIDSQDDPDRAALVRLLGRFFEQTARFRPHVSTVRERQIAGYAAYLREVRGFARSTVRQHCQTTTAFLRFLRATPERLARLTAQDLEAFIRYRGPHLARVSLQHEVAHLRAFVRFLAVRGEGPVGLDTSIDTPRVYRDEQLPRALPWETVRALLTAIDQRTCLGRRDYAMFVLIATYGLRASEVVGLTLDDLDWRGRRIRVRQRKTGALLWLPLTDEVGTAVVAYLRHARPHLTVRTDRRAPVTFSDPASACREVFLRARTPVGPLKPTAITESFQAWSRRSGLAIPYQGVHCLRHSYAVHLLRSGVSLQAIGDVLGHRTFESTCVYLRLAVDDLREVALPVPQGTGDVRAGAQP